MAPLNARFRSLLPRVAGAEILRIFENSRLARAKGNRYGNRKFISTA